MEVPDKVFFQCTLKVGVVYYYENPEIKNSDEPHYHIVLFKDKNKTIVLACSTTKTKKRELFVKRRNLPKETLVMITPSSKNGFTQESVVDCNSLFEQNEDFLAKIYNEKYIKHKGEIEEDYLARLLLGIQRSPMISKGIKKLLS